MTIRTYNDDISRDFNILGDNVYIGNGQGCGTIWFKSVPIARKFLERIGWNWNFGGQKNSGLCDCCACHYSNNDPKQFGLSEFMCREWKENIKKEVENNMRVI